MSFHTSSGLVFCRWRSGVALAATCLAAWSTGALADDPLPRNELAIGVSQLVAPYQAGAKFRTPESIESAIADDLATGLGTRAELRKVDLGSRRQLLAPGNLDLVLVTLARHDALVRSANFIPTGYAAGPMAIMRTDTTIKSWEKLKGRTVCLTQGGMYAGMLARRYGAIEMPFAAPADSLIALRTGSCDAAVHDSVLLEELIRLPEWKKFSARLPATLDLTLGIFLPSIRADAKRDIQAVVNTWQRTGHLQQLNSKRARQIAFEVYLDQDVPDCH